MKPRRCGVFLGENSFKVQGSKKEIRLSIYIYIHSFVQRFDTFVIVVGSFVRACFSSVNFLLDLACAEKKKHGPELITLCTFAALVSRD